MSRADCALSSAVRSGRSAGQQALQRAPAAGAQAARRQARPEGRQVGKARPRCLRPLTSGNATKPKARESVIGGPCSARAARKKEAINSCGKHARPPEIEPTRICKREDRPRHVEWRPRPLSLSLSRTPFRNRSQ